MRCSDPSSVVKNTPNIPKQIQKHDLTGNPKNPLLVKFETLPGQLSQVLAYVRDEAPIIIHIDIAARLESLQAVFPGGEKAKKYFPISAKNEISRRFLGGPRNMQNVIKTVLKTCKSQSQ